MIKRLLIVLLLTVFCGGCFTAADKQAEGRRLYIEEGEFDNSEELANIQRERRGAPPVVESNYIFRVTPKDTYFYNEKSEPIHGGAELTASSAVEAGLASYKDAYVVKKAVRYMGESYFGGDAGGGQAEAAADEEGVLVEDEEW